mgnify:CR=1 FL=1
MSRKKISVLCALVFLLFLGIMDYPFLARIYNGRVQGQAVTGYETGALAMEEDEKTEALEEARAYNQALAEKNGAALQDAFQSEGKAEGQYGSILASEDGVMAVVEIPKLGLSLPVYHGTSEETLQRGAGHLEGSSFPVGGAGSHTCISAHRGLPGKEMFTSLDLLSEGDVFYLRVLGETLAYEIRGIETVTPDQVEPLRIRPGEDLATLITCTPYGINTHRLYVHGRRIPFAEAEEKEAERQEAEGWSRIWQEYWWVFVNLLLIAWMIFLLYWLNRRRKQR